MTIETTVNKTIQSGNGSNKDFDFAFEIPDEDSLSLTKRGSDGTETAITTNYTVTGIGDEAGGTVNYPTSGSALASNEKIIIKRVVALKQLENLRNQGDYSLEDIEDALDRAVMLCQQLQEQIDRSLKLPLTSSSTYVTVDDFVANKLLYVSSDGTKVKMSDADFGSIQTYLTALAAIAADISAVAAIDTEVTTVAGISANVTTVAGIDTEVTTVAGIAADVSAVAAIDSDVTQVSSIHAAVSTVSGIAAAVSTVAGISAAVSTVSGIAAAVSGVNTIAAAVSGVYAIDDDVVAVAAIAAAVSAVNSNSANINTVAGIAAAVTSVAAISANVSTVAGISANVTTVAGMESNIASVVANMASILNAASFGFPTLAGGDANKYLKVNSGENGYELSTLDWVKISSASAVGVASIDFTGLSSAYKAYQLVLTGIVPATDGATLSLRTSANNGSSYDAGASDYAWGLHYTDFASPGAASPAVVTDNADSKIQISAGGSGNDTNEIAELTVTILNPSAVTHTSVTFHGVQTSSSAVTYAFYGAGRRLSAAAVNALQVLFSSGNISGLATLYGLKA